MVFCDTVPILVWCIFPDDIANFRPLLRLSETTSSLFIGVTAVLASGDLDIAFIPFSEVGRRREIRFLLIPIIFDRFRSVCRSTARPAFSSLFSCSSFQSRTPHCTLRKNYFRTRVFTCGRRLTAILTLRLKIGSQDEKFTVVAFYETSKFALKCCTKEKTNRFPNASCLRNAIL